MLAPLRIGCFAVICGCANGPLDSLDPTHHEVHPEAGAPAEGYAHVARRQLVAVGLAEARGIDTADANRAVDRLADEAAPCFAKFGDKLVRGAARIIVPVDSGGVVQEPQVTFSATQGAAVQAMLCLVSHIRMSTFAPSNAQTRALAIEAAWGSDVAP